MSPDTPRAVRKKLLLLEGSLHRLEILEAKEALRSGVVNSVVGQRLPGVLGLLFQHKTGALLASLLPLLIGAGRVARVARRGTLVLGAGAALLGLFKRWRRGRPAVEPMAQEGDTSAHEAFADVVTEPGRRDHAGEKNPGQGRD